MAKIWHPDKHPDNQEEAKAKFQEVRQSHAWLLHCCRCEACLMSSRRSGPHERHEVRAQWSCGCDAYALFALCLRQRFLQCRRSSARTSLS